MNDFNKCFVHGCNNTRAQGAFVDGLCRPCYEMLRSGNPGHGRTFIHLLTAERDRLRSEIEWFIKSFDPIAARAALLQRNESCCPQSAVSGTLRHDVKCKKFHDPYDERDPTGPCTCGAESPSSASSEQKT